MDQIDDELRENNEDIEKARRWTLDLRLRQGFICPESAFSHPLTLEILPRKSAVDQRNPALQRAKTTSTAIFVEDIQE